MFTHIDHIAIAVEDMDAHRARFEDVYGFECWGTNSKDHKQQSGADAAFFDAGEVTLELMSPFAEPTGETWNTATFLAEHGEGFYHIAYAVDDIYAGMQALRDAGIRLMSDEPGTGFSGKLVSCHPADTILMMQIVEPTERT